MERAVAGEPPNGLDDGGGLNGVIISTATSPGLLGGEANVIGCGASSDGFEL